MIVSLVFILRVALIPRGLITTAETNFDEFEGKDCVFVTDWSKIKGFTSCVLYLKVFKNDLYL